MFDDLFDDISDVFGDATDGLGDAMDSFSDATSMFDASLPTCDIVPDISDGIDVFDVGPSDMFAEAGDFSGGVNIFGLEDGLAEPSEFAFGDGDVFGSDSMLMAGNETSFGSESIFGTDSLEPMQTNSFAEENVFGIKLNTIFPPYST